MHDQRMNKLPVLISYPRSGSNWFNAVIELYFDRPRLRVGQSSFLKNINNRRNYMWFHDHDIQSILNLPHNNIAYLYRNPSDVIYSLLTAESKPINKKTIDYQIYLLSKHYNKYLVVPTKCTLKYEKLKSSEYKLEFIKFINFLDEKERLNEVKLDKCISIVKKEKVIEKNTNNVYFSENLIKQEYSDNREKFKLSFDNYIKDHLINYSCLL